MAKKTKRGLTPERVEMEIDRLRNSEAVKLARLEKHFEYRRRKYLCRLRALERRGRVLQQVGLTREVTEALHQTFDFS